jgi:hypothetical protein
MPRHLAAQHEAPTDRIDEAVTDGQRLQWLRAKMATAEEQVRRGEVVELTDELLEELDREVDGRLRSAGHSS